MQVYLEPADRGTLEQLARHLELSKSDVIRRALAALERQTFAADAHPTLRLIGMVAEEAAAPLAYDPAAEHDRYLADVMDPKPARKQRRGR